MLSRREQDRGLYLEQKGRRRCCCYATNDAREIVRVRARFLECALEEWNVKRLPYTTKTTEYGSPAVQSYILNLL